PGAPELPGTGGGATVANRPKAPKSAHIAVQNPAERPDVAEDNGVEQAFMPAVPVCHCPASAAEVLDFDHRCPSFLICAHLRKSAAKGFSFPSSDLAECPLQLNHLHRTLWPVVLPAHNQIASLRVVRMVQKIAAFKFNLYPYPLPPPRCHLAIGLHIGELRSNKRHKKPQPVRHRSKQEHHAHLIHWGKAQRRAQKRRSTQGPV